jgi:YVTN family beta-propeller protein
MRRLASLLLFFTAILALASLAMHSWAQPLTTLLPMLTIANQGDHTLVLFDVSTRKQIAVVEVGVNGHEVAVSPDGAFAYVPIYGNSGVGKPGTDGQFIDIVDLQTHALAGHIDLGKPVRPHCAKFGPDGLLYVSAELSKAIFVVDTASRKVVGEIPTGAEQSHMFVISPDGAKAYTANVSTGSVSVLDLKKRSLITIIPVAKTVQRISISPDGRYVFTHDQDQPRIAMIETATNKVRSWFDVPGTVYTSAVTPDNKYLVAGSPAGKIFILDLSLERLSSPTYVRASIDVPASTGELILSPNGTHAVLSCPQLGSLQILDLPSGQLEPPIQLTKGVDGLDWAGNCCW